MNHCPSNCHSFYHFSFRLIIFNRFCSFYRTFFGTLLYATLTRRMNDLIDCRRYFLFFAVILIFSFLLLIGLVCGLVCWGLIFKKAHKESHIFIIPLVLLHFSSSFSFFFFNFSFLSYLQHNRTNCR